MSIELMIYGPFDFDLVRKVRRAKGLAGQSPIRIAAEGLVFTAEMAHQRNQVIKAYNAKADRFIEITTPAVDAPRVSVSSGSRVI